MRMRHKVKKILSHLAFLFSFHYSTTVKILFHFPPANFHSQRPANIYITLEQWEGLIQII